ncbi:molybdopterin-guanine dinucleotide biosynthesis protein B [Tianweitania sp. BSSL-BM11]|uniref:Molybdopterin-guanine dinucleotide biosynthesis protein B n=1 Tax=Tianweitania aestuarii TaxID=2814886 RepID=A0ABS5RUK6_9HYPH|nr:molybdopterin-guanine dinucleotide biosynthesis protein B [Tianweitania aestuarii]MBS9720750.1 molybdopterin-guanine dinucleotide biosynthesis protein B [Tianweitania aestuarii]
MTHRVFGITGWKNSGKTTLTERLVTELTARGYTVSTIKHAHHDFDIDVPGTDSFRHRAAGASEVAIVSSHRWALMHEMRGDAEPSLTEILDRLSPCDLVLVEGYKREDHLKIEARRKDTATRAPLAESDPKIVALATDHPVEGAALPVFDLDNIPTIADFIVETLSISRR